jgi:hypothetical protein
VRSRAHSRHLRKELDMPMIRRRSLRWAAIVAAISCSLVSLGCLALRPGSTGSLRTALNMGALLLVIVFVSTRGRGSDEAANPRR